MRIVGGRFKRRQLATPSDSRIRPTSDRLRETLFNVLGPGVEGARVLDAFAGTGALGLEALSRGARSVIFVEHDRHAAGFVAENVRRCEADDVATIVRGSFPGRAVPPGPFDLILLDPPYDLSDLEGTIAAGAPLLAEHGRLVLEHARRRRAPDRAGTLERVRLLEAGDSALSFYRHAGDQAPAAPS